MMEKESMVLSNFFDSMIMNIITKEIDNDCRFYVRPLLPEDIHNFNLQHTNCECKFDELIIYSRNFILYDFSKDRWYILDCNVFSTATIGIYVYPMENEFLQVARIFINVF